MAHLFFSYSHKDEVHRKRLEAHLATLKRQNLITGWHDRLIRAGQDWRQQIEEQMDRADMILLLISSEFLASDFCFSVEMTRALERHAAGLSCVIPVILRPVEWRDTPFGKLQALPRDGRPVTKWTNRDEAWLDVVGGIRAALTDLKGRQPSTPPRPPSPSLPQRAAAIHDSRESPAATEVPGEELRERVLLSESEFSQIVRADHPTHGPVILKVLRNTPPECREWISSATYAQVNEARLLNRGTLPTGESFLLFRFIEGESLFKAVRAGNVIRGALLDDILLQVLTQLGPLSEGPASIVHRDVTPWNLLVSLEDGEVRVRLIDFESGCLAGAPQTPIRAAGFTAPEQDGGKAVPSSDLFALARTAYYLATGRIASGAREERDLLERSMGELTTLSEHYSQQVILDSLSTQVSNRPESAAAILSSGERDSKTKKMPPRVELGLFTFGASSVRLFNTYYEVDSKA